MSHSLQLHQNPHHPQRIQPTILSHRRPQHPAPPSAAVRAACQQPDADPRLSSPPKTVMLEVSTKIKDQGSGDTMPEKTARNQTLIEILLEEISLTRRQAAPHRLPFTAPLSSNP